MQTNNGIYIDVLNANTPNRVPLSVLLEGGITLVRIPHGPFKIRIITPHQTDVNVVLDDKTLLTTKVAPGMTELDRGANGVFNFAPATVSDTMPGPGTAIETDEGAAPAQAAQVIEAETAANVVTGKTAEGAETGENKSAAANEAVVPTQPPHIAGFLLVAVKFTEQPPVPGERPLPNNTEEAAFQMNPPHEHALAIAANFHNIVPPEKIQPRWCSHCRRLER